MPAGATNLSAADFNHDGRTDLAAQPDLLLLNRRANSKRRPARPAGSGTSTPISTARDGWRAHLAADGALMLDRDVTPNYGNWIEIALIGVKNLKSAVGAKVEVKAGTLYEKQTYEGLPLVFRLGSEKSVDTVRITWPNGLIQNEMNQPVNKLADIKEAQRLSGSCPMIFTWDGSRFVFITDVLGVAPLGASSGDGQIFPRGPRRVRVDSRRDAASSATARTKSASPRNCTRSRTSTRSGCRRWTIRQIPKSSPTRSSSLRRFPSSACSV